MTKPKPTPEELSRIRAEAGRKGGTATRDRHGLEHFRRIGSHPKPTPTQEADAPKDDGPQDDTGDG